MLCKTKGIEIIEAECCRDHIHMLVKIPPKYSVSQIMRYLKGKGSLMIFDRHANLKYKYGNRHFWCRGYYVDTVGKMQRKSKNIFGTKFKKIWSTIKCHWKNILTRLRVSGKPRQEINPLGLAREISAAGGLFSTCLDVSRD